MRAESGHSQDELPDRAQGGGGAALKFGFQPEMKPNASILLFQELEGVSGASRSSSTLGLSLH